MQLHKATNYRPIEVRNPFIDGGDKAYADLLFQCQKDKNWWRNIVGAGTLILFVITFCFFVYAVNLQKTVPVLINVMPNGEAAYLGEVQQKSVQVPESALQFQVRKFISNLRSVSSDNQVLYNNIDECYSMITTSYEPVMTRMLRSNSPFDLVGKTRRSVEVESVLRITGSSFQIDWIETETSQTLSPKRRRMRALVTIQILAPDNNTIKRNPLGIYIENCEMTEL
ncbi:MAG: conjugal transfer protein TrbF [Termitinemataceae bacterium]|nr:MAG: conjugal transfer protein TrbF [Termitinemataceae bacterium]